MKYLTKLAVVIAVALATAACSKSDAILSRVSTIVTASNGKLLTDRGETFLINSGAEGKDLSSGRFFVVCDVLTNRGGGTYDVNVLNIVGALVKDIRNDGQTLEPEVLVEDPISPESVWISGGYINMETLVFHIKDSETKHLLNLVMDTKKSNADTVYFDVRHNAYGETPDNPSFAAREFVGGVAYASFPMSSLPSPILKKTVFTFRFNWYNDYEKFTKEKYSVSGIYEPEVKDK